MALPLHHEMFKCISDQRGEIKPDPQKGASDFFALVFLSTKWEKVFHVMEWCFVSKQTALVVTERHRVVTGDNQPEQFAPGHPSFLGQWTRGSGQSNRAQNLRTWDQEESLS